MQTEGLHTMDFLFCWREGMGGTVLSCRALQVHKDPVLIGKVSLPEPTGLIEVEFWNGIFPLLTEKLLKKQALFQREIEALSISLHQYINFDNILQWKN